MSSVFESPENLDSNHDASEDGKETSKSRKKRKAAVASLTPNPDSKKVWSKNEELVILKGIVDYQNETGVKYFSDSGAFFDYIKKDIDGEFSKDQLMRKIRKLKKRFLNHMVKKTCFTSPEDSELFELSMKTWDKDNAECADGNIDKANGTKSRSKRKSKSKKARLAFVEHEAVINGEPEDDDGLGKDTTCDNESPAGNVDKQTENETGVKESEEDEPKNDDGSEKDGSFEDKFPNENLDNPMEEEVSEDELLALNDALETMMFEGINKHGKKLMLRKLMKLGATERKELSDEWKALLLQDTLLKCKKQFLSVKLGKAILDD